MTDREHDQLLARATDRFERRLSEETTAVRAAIGQVRVAMIEGDAATRLEVARLRVDMSEQFAASRIDSERRHRELLKWAFVFWVGQATATAGIMRALMP